MRPPVLFLACVAVATSASAEASLRTWCAALLAKKPPAPAAPAVAEDDRIGSFGGPDGDLQHSFLPLMAKNNDSNVIAADAWQDVSLEAIGDSFRNGHVGDASAEEWRTTNWWQYWESKGARLDTGYGMFHRSLVPHVVGSERFAIKNRRMLLKAYAPAFVLETSGNSLRFHQAILALRNVRSLRLTGPMAVRLLQHFSARRAVLPEEGCDLEHMMSDRREPFYRAVATAFPRLLPEYLVDVNADASTLFAGLADFPNLRTLEVWSDYVAPNLKLTLTGAALRVATEAPFTEID